MSEFGSFNPENQEKVPPAPPAPDFKPFSEIPPEDIKQAKRLGILTRIKRKFGQSKTTEQATSENETEH